LVGGALDRSALVKGLAAGDGGHIRDPLTACLGWPAVHRELLRCLPIGRGMRPKVAFNVLSIALAKGFAI
jgi:hypothetical protein